MSYPGLLTLPVGDPDDDDWSGVQDPRKRKQIQDRLAQRARRRRISERKNEGLLRAAEERHSNALQLAATKGADIGDAFDSFGSTPTVACWDTSTTGSSTADSASSSTTSSIPSSVFPSSVDTDHCPLPQQNFSVYAAMFNNGRILGLTCSNQVPAKSRPAGPDIPLSLRPTLLQLNTIHIPWIDRFPFPEMRDNAIMMSDVIDEEEFMGDLFTMPSFEMVPGVVSWDPAGWKIGKEFGEKWGFLWSGMSQ